MKDSIGVAATQALLDRLQIYDKRLFLVPWHRLRPQKDTVLLHTGYYRGLPHLYLIETDRWFPGGEEVQMHPHMKGDAISFAFTTLGGEGISMEVPSRLEDGAIITFDFDPPWWMT